MAGKRTRREKELARLRRLVERTQTKPIVREEAVKVETEKMADIKADSYIPTRDLPIKLLRLDLTKAVSVTILALILQFTLMFYLNRGGWIFVSQMLFHKLLNN